MIFRDAKHCIAVFFAFLFHVKHCFLLKSFQKCFT